MTLDDLNSRLLSPIRNFQTAHLVVSETTTWELVKLLSSAM